MPRLTAQEIGPEGTILCVDEAGDEYEIVVDDALRALVHPAETPVENEPVAEPPTIDVPLSPREIQARIRSGTTVAELAEVTGVREEKIRRFAHPVLLERARAAELARASHPAGIDGPNSANLGELVAECLALRGNSVADAEWDAWRPHDGRWIVQVGWPGAGDVEFAHWRFIPGSHGGITEPLDDLAVELTEPELARAARRSVVAAVPSQPAPQPIRREVLADGHEQVTVDADRLIERQSAPLELDFDVATRSESPATTPSQQPRHRSGKRATPTVPAWEDVLLGVRSHPGE